MHHFPQPSVVTRVAEARGGYWVGASVDVTSIARLRPYAGDGSGPRGSASRKSSAHPTDQHYSARSGCSVGPGHRRCPAAGPAVQRTVARLVLGAPPPRRYCVATPEAGDSEGIALLALRPVSASLRLRWRSATFCARLRLRRTQVAATHHRGRLGLPLPIRSFSPHRHTRKAVLCYICSRTHFKNRHLP